MMGRNLLAIILILLLASLCFASWEFEEGAEYVYLNDDAKLTLPNADFTVGGWFKLDDNTGTGSQGLVGWYDGAGTSACVAFNIYEHSNGTSPDKLEVVLCNPTSSWNVFLSSTTPGTSTDWQHVLLERDAGMYRVYVNNVSVAYSNFGGYGAVDEDSVWKFGVNLGGYLAEWAKWDVALSSDQRDHLRGAGTGDAGDPCTPDNIGATPIWYCDMYDAFDCQVGGLTVTNNNATTDTLHPVSYATAPAKAGTPSPADAATGQSITVDCSWAAASGATSYDVYFGTDSTPDETEFIGNQPGLTYDPGTLAYSSIYYWRIDTKNDVGTTTGDVWHFHTADPPITIVSYTTATNTASNQWSCDKPASVQDNDLLLAFVAFDRSGTITKPDGWTARITQSTTVETDLSTGIYWKLADASEEPASYLWAISSSGYSAGGIVCLRGVHQSQVFDVGPGYVTGTNWNNNGACPSITTTSMGARYFTCFVLTNEATGPTAPSPTTATFSALNGSGGSPGINVMVSSATKVSPGATGALTWGLSTFDNQGEWHGYQVALRSDDITGSAAHPRGAMLHNQRRRSE